MIVKIIIIKIYLDYIIELTTFIYLTYPISPPMTNYCITLVCFLQKIIPARSPMLNNILTISSETFNGISYNEDFNFFDFKLTALSMVKEKG